MKHAIAVSPGRLRSTFGVGLVVALSFAASLGVIRTAAQAPSPPAGLVVSRNVNMVSGQTLPGGDPYLQRQNEPTVAASTRNPLHLLAGANDYRTVDIPGNFNDGETGDAWLGVFKSLDGGERWQSTLLPGYPQDTSPEGMASPLKAYHAGADPVVRPGTNGMLYFAGLAFNRGEGAPSAIFASRFIDNNNKENGDPIAYISTSIIAKSTGETFLDKPWLAVDIPRAGAKACVIETTGRAANPKAAQPVARGGKPPAKGGHPQKGGNPQPAPGQTKPITQQILAGTMYVAYASITNSGAGAADVEARIMLSRSDDCGATWSTPAQISAPEDRVNQGATIAIDPRTGVVHVVWRQFGLSASAPDAIMITSSSDAGKKFDKPRKAYRFKKGGDASQLLPKLKRGHRMGDVHQLAAINPFDSGTTEHRFRTNAYPAMAIDDQSRVYLAWTERGYAGARPDATEGDARIVLTTSRNGSTWTAPRPVDSLPQGSDRPGHQMMPSMAYAGGRLMIAYYDLREDVSQVFGPFVNESHAIAYANRRHTIDLRAVQAAGGDVPVFAPSRQISTYLMGNLRGSSQLQQLQYNAPNLPLFQLGSVPFMGDYIDIAPAPAFVQNASGAWSYNTAATTAPVFHAVWTDNRDVQKPADGNWKNYTPPDTASCAPGQAGMRNQNVYSARLTMGLVTGSPGNSKPLDSTLPRGFVVFAQNTTFGVKSFRMTIASQPVGGRASFTQAGSLTTLDVQVAPRSMVTRTVFVTSSDPRAQVHVDVREIDFPHASGVVAGGLASRVVLNPDISNPDISNPDISNPDISNPDISNAELYNPDISNPDISNPDISNPDISNPDISNPDISNIRVANPDISNPDISNPDISNPDISNPDISNPDISNPDISNGSLTDVTWTVTNTGNTTASFNVNLFLANQAAAAAGGIKTQLVVHKTYKTPVTDGCELKTQQQTVLVANVVNPVLKAPGDTSAFNPANPDISNTTLWLEPGGEGKITLRIVDPNPHDNISINPVQDVTPVVRAEGVNTPALYTPGATPPSTTPPVAPPVALAFVAQPVTTAVGMTLPSVAVRATTNQPQAGTPLAGVQVTLAIAVNPGAGHLSGVVTRLTDGAGVATFTGLSIERAGTGYQLSASASALGALPALSAPFTIGADTPPVSTGWLAGGSGFTSVTDTGLTGTPSMQYRYNGPDDGPTPGPYSGVWQFWTVATAPGNIGLAWNWAGFHSYFQVTARLEVVINRGGVDIFAADLLNVGPLDCCTTPSGGFAYSGATSIVVQAGDVYGFRLSGSHGDIAETLEGTLNVAVNGAPSIMELRPADFVAAGFGQMLTIRGVNLPTVAAAGVIFSQGGADFAAHYLWASDPTRAVARLPLGALAAGPATVRLRNASGTVTTQAFPLVISTTPGAPTVVAMTDGCGGGGVIESAAPGQNVAFLGEGLDTAGATVHWTRDGETTVEVPVQATTSNSGYVAACTTLPTLAPGQWNVQISTTVNGVASGPSYRALTVMVLAQVQDPRQ